jgi:hypothetical protein
VDRETTRAIPQQRELCEMIWTLRAELDDYQAGLRLLRRDGRHPSDRELLEAAVALEELARAAGVLVADAASLHRDHARRKDIARFRSDRAA